MHLSPIGGSTTRFLLPFKIALATAAASDPTRIVLRSAERCLLCYLLQRVSVATPLTPFRCRVDKLAAEFDVTTRSVHNWLAGLREGGLLQFKQRRNHFGSFGLAAVLTQKAIDLLGLLDELPPKTYPGVKPNNDQSFEKNISGTDRSVNNLINIQPDGNVLKNRRGQLPEDVNELNQQHALTVPTVFWLMKQASSKSNNLGSILKVAGKYLQGKSPGAIKAYLMRCINSGRDYDAPASYEPTTGTAITPKGMKKVLSDAVDSAGGRLAMRAGAFLTVEQDMLMRCRSLNNGRLDPCGVVAGEMLTVLYERWLAQGDLQ